MATFRATLNALIENARSLRYQEDQATEYGLGSEYNRALIELIASTMPGDSEINKAWVETQINKA